jgi:hypothetical protein
MARDPAGSGRWRDERAHLRESVLRIGGLMGWQPHDIIAFTELLTDCPWNRCGAEEFRAVLEEYRSIARAAEARESRARSPDGWTPR